MAKFTTPMDYWMSGFQATLMLAEANAVIAMRMLGMAGIWSVPPSENTRMVTEKMAALSTAMARGTQAAMTGGSPDQVASAVIKPLRSKTRSNVRRLSKRGVKRR